MTEDLEQLLRQLPLRRPSLELDGRVREVLSGSDTAVPPARRQPVRHRTGLAWAAAAAAAVLLALATAWYAGHVSHTPTPITKAPATAPRSPSDEALASSPRMPTAAAPPLPFEELGFDRVDSRVIDRGVVVTADAVPFRRFRQQTLRQVWWYDAQTQTQMMATVPAERDVYIQQAVY